MGCELGIGFAMGIGGSYKNPKKPLVPLFYCGRADAGGISRSVKKIVKYALYPIPLSVSSILYLHKNKDNGRITNSERQVNQ